jgi:hypothetical protein
LLDDFHDFPKMYPPLMQRLEMLTVLEMNRMTAAGENLFRDVSRQARAASADQPQTGDMPTAPGVVIF